MYTINQIIGQKPSEGHNLDYKRELSVDTQEGKKKFVTDIVSFLNAEGGQLFIGIEEKDGIPVLPLYGWEGDFDSFKLSLSSIARDNILPKVYGLDIQFHEVDDKNILEIRIPKGVNRPYAVKSNKNYNYKRRHENGNVTMTPTEVQRQSIETYLSANQLDDYARGRIKWITRNVLPNLKGRVGLVLHMIPYGALTVFGQVDLTVYHRAKLNPVGAPHARRTDWNVDGVVVSSDYYRKLDYLQIHRNGVFESVSFGDMLNSTNMDKPIKKKLPSVVVENSIIQSVDEYLSILRSSIAGLPIYIYASFLNAKGVVFGGNRTAMQSPYIPFSRPILNLVPVIIKDYDINVKMVLRPMIDSMYNAFGDPGSPYYDSSED